MRTFKAIHYPDKSVIIRPDTRECCRVFTGAAHRSRSENFVEWLNFAYFVGAKRENVKHGLQTQ